MQKESGSSSSSGIAADNKMAFSIEIIITVSTVSRRILNKKGKNCQYLPYQNVGV